MKYQNLICNPNFKLIETLDHSEAKRFVRRELTDNQGWALVAKMYQGFGLLLFGFGLIKAFAFFIKNKDSVMLEYLGWGILFSFTGLIIIHELLHFFAYIAVGAKKLSFGMKKLRKFMFYVQANRQVMNYKRFAIVALAPAVLVGVCSIVGAIVWFEKPLYYFFLSILALHSLFCSGDMGLLCFFENRKEDEIYTFDIPEEGKTYYYKKIK